ncbi:hypothetical protein [Hansschlegelia sp.]|uniref:hypothetical protein n=1 Tax=Hansschlegelia sp. TaxID=2041892 RepID=UPI002B96C33E|nr:hypothetical protein [Hansschlegelia sp.]HVI28097.1 hypothetical protein [Hansschlegelia sp.]
MSAPRIKSTSELNAEPLLTLDVINEQIDAYNADCAEEGEPFEEVTLPRVLTELLLGPDHQSGCYDYEAAQVVQTINSRIIAEAASRADVDPWPNLSRWMVIHMVGNRTSYRTHPGILKIIRGGDTGADSPLTLEEKFLCARYRKWLEAPSKKRAAA